MNGLFLERELWVERDGMRIFGMLYVPENVDAHCPRPAVVCSHILGGTYKNTDPRAPEKARLLVQAGDMRLLKAALDEGADGVVYAPEDLTERGLERAAREADGMSFDLSLPMTMAGETLDRLNGWARACGRVNRIIVNNVGHLGLEWPVPLVLGTGLNLASRRALQALWTDAVRAYMPSIELTAGEIAALGGGALREIMVYGRVQLMSLRHCPIRAQLGGRHADCRRCDRVPPGEEMNAHCLVDSTGVSLPLRRQKSSEGCVVRLLADRPLMFLRHVNRLPACAAWHVCLTDEDETLAAAVVRAHRLALNGDAQAALDALPGDMLTTTGHYFRAVE